MDGAGRAADGDLLTWQLARKSAMSVLQVGQGFTTFCTLRVLPARAPLFTVSPCPYNSHGGLDSKLRSKVFFPLWGCIGTCMRMYVRLLHSLQRVGSPTAIRQSVLHATCQQSECHQTLSLACDSYVRPQLQATFGRLRYSYLKVLVQAGTAEVMSTRCADRLLQRT